MKKRVIRIGGTTTIGISFDKDDKAWYKIAKGDFVVFDIIKVLSPDKKLKYSKAKTEEEK